MSMWDTDILLVIDPLILSLRRAWEHIQSNQLGPSLEQYGPKNLLKFCPQGRFLSFNLLLFRGTLEWALISWLSTSVCCQPQISLPHHSVIWDISWSSVSPRSELRERGQHERHNPTILDNILFKFLPWGSS